MARTVTLNGVNFSVPELNDTGYGAALTSYLVALAQAFPQLGGAAALLSELDLGANFGVKALYLKSETASPAGSGLVRLAAADSIAWRNAANSADVALAKDAGDALLFGGANVTGNPMLAATTAAGQSIPTGVATIVVFGTVELDSDAAYNSGTGRFTVPAGKGGDYEIAAQITWSASPGPNPIIAVYKNAVVIRDAVASVAALVVQPISCIVRLAAGDVLDIRVNQGSGGAVTLQALAPRNFFSLKRIPS